MGHTCLWDQLIVGFGLFAGFVDIQINTEYHQLSFQ